MFCLANAQSISVFQFNGEQIGKPVKQLSQVFEVIDQSGLVDPEYGGDFIVYEGHLSPKKVEKSLKEIKNLVDFKYPYIYDLNFSGVQCNIKNANGLPTGVWRIASVFEDEKYFSLEKPVKNGLLNGDYKVIYPNSKKLNNCKFFNGVAQSYVSIEPNGDSIIAYFDSCNVELERRTFNASNKLLRTYSWIPNEGGLGVEMDENGRIIHYQVFGKNKEVVEVDVTNKNQPLINMFNQNDSMKWVEVKGSKNGPCIKYYKNGIVKEITNYMLGQKVGEYKFYHTNGLIAISGKYGYETALGVIKRDYEIDTNYYYPELDTFLITPDPKIKDFMGREVKPIPVYSESIKHIKEGVWKYYNDKGELIKEENYRYKSCK